MNIGHSFNRRPGGVIVRVIGRSSCCNDLAVRVGADEVEINPMEIEN